MRSEKEIREKLESKEAVRKAMGMVDAPLDYEMSIFKWFLEGEPRYSVAELEKIFQYLISLEKTDSYEWDVAYFIEFLKDRKKVEEILDG